MSFLQKLVYKKFEEIKIWLNTIFRAKKELSKENIITSLNPWHTLLHCDRGRKLKSTQKFQLMVDYQGNQANCCVCPLDENWQKYIFKIFQLDSRLVWFSSGSKRKIFGAKRGRIYYGS